MTLLEQALAVKPSRNLIGKIDTTAETVAVVVAYFEGSISAAQVFAVFMPNADKPKQINANIDSMCTSLLRRALRAGLITITINEDAAKVSNAS